ncbi:MAG: TonB-dependent receptor [Bacteroidota bacterium]
MQLENLIPSGSIIALLLACVVPAIAQTPPDSTLPVIEITEAAPYQLSERTAPFALAVRVRPAVEIAAEPALTLDGALAGVPGVWASNRESYAQGERLLVRGLGWRAAFGVRGTHVLLDGVPLTLADGQTQLNVIDPALVRRVEVLRGPASTFWGSGAGGVVALSTRGEGAVVEARAMGGGYGVASANLVVRPRLPDGQRLTAWASGFQQRGYRDHSETELIRAGVSGERQTSFGRLSVVGLLAHMPQAESPGGISFEAFDEDPQQTRPIVLDRQAGKQVTQGHLSVSLRRPVGTTLLDATLTGGWRDLDNPIVPRYIQLDRRTLGSRLTLEGAGAVRWAIGGEAELQRDDRLETANEGGQPGADVQTDQLETVTSAALFGRVAFDLAPNLTATLAGRADALRYEADPAAGPSDERLVRALSPSVGVSYRPAPNVTLYTNVAGALDAPTTTELGNRPDGAPGFDPTLEPERTWGGEAGMRVQFAGPSGQAVDLDASVYVARVSDLLVPFEQDDITFFRNEGRTRHAGVEIGIAPVNVQLGPASLNGAVAYAWTHARFTESAGTLVIEGNQVPGVPEHLLTWSVNFRTGPVVLGLSGEAASGYPPDSRNTAETEAYAVVNLRVSAPDLSADQTRLTPFVSLRNAFDARYAGSVVVNAFGGRFVEPAAGRAVLGGIAVAFN